MNLEPLTDEQSLAYLQELWPKYRDELVRAGSSESEADANVARNQQSVTADGVLVPGHRMFRLTENDNHIGNLWLCQRDNAGEWFIYDIEVFEAYRGRGLGRQAMEHAQAYAKERGAKKLGLSVFGFNTVARSLYESLGYSIVAIAMVKELS